MRTQDEIVARIESLKKGDMFGFETNDLKLALDFEHVLPYLEPDHGTYKAEWERVPYTPERARESIRDYLPFAWEKVKGERGISASRSISHFEQWMWLAGDDDVLERVNAAPYSPYGQPKLAIIEAHYGHSAKDPLPAATPSTTTSVKTDNIMPEDTKPAQSIGNSSAASESRPANRRIRVVVETYRQVDGGDDVLEDRNVTESRNLTVPQIIEMRTPLIEVQKLWNEGDSD